MSSKSATDGAGAGRASWRQAVSSYQSPDLRRSLWQIVNTFVPYIVLWVLMVSSLEVSYWLTLALAVPAAGFLVRIFIFFHDCGHGSFFKSQRANDILGIITGILTFTPYYAWRHAHAIHHATAGNLDRRGVGDIWSLTVQEYLAAPTWKRLAYRIFRFPPVTFLIGPIVVFLVLQRFPLGEKAPRERMSVWATDLALLGVAALVSAFIGLRAYLLIQIPVMVIAGTVGVWLFYVQHQFEGVYWERHANWDFVTSAMQGASFYRLPKVLQWFSGNIGFHHIHHLSPKIPNYKLQDCFEANPIFQQVQPITLRSSFKSLRLHLWDEENRRLVGFGHLKTLPVRARLSDYSAGG